MSGSFAMPTCGAQSLTCSHDAVPEPFLGLDQLLHLLLRQEQLPWQMLPAELVHRGMLQLQGPAA